MVLLEVRTLGVERGFHHHPFVIVAVIGDKECIIAFDCLKEMKMEKKKIGHVYL